MEKTLLAALDAYCREHIEDYEERVSRALNKIDRCRCPLHMADTELASDMENCIDEWWEDNRPGTEAVLFYCND